jgi:hypothetical protein
VAAGFLIIRFWVVAISGTFVGAAVGAEFAHNGRTVVGVSTGVDIAVGA